MPARDSTQTRDTPTRLVLQAAARTVQRYHLPYRSDVDALVNEPGDQLGMRRATGWFATLAIEEMEKRAERLAMTDLDVGILTMRAVFGATTLTWRVRELGAPAMDAWELLVMIISVVYGRARDNATTAELATWIGALATDLTHTMPEAKEN